MITELEEITKCLWFDIAKSQRETETSRGLDESGTESYETRGCYECEGSKTNCGEYVRNIKRYKNE